MPYPLFLFPAMIVFQYFNSATGRASNSLKQDSAIGEGLFPAAGAPLGEHHQPAGRLRARDSRGDPGDLPAPPTAAMHDAGVSHDRDRRSRRDDGLSVLNCTSAT